MFDNDSAIFISSLNLKDPSMKGRYNFTEKDVFLFQFQVRFSSKNACVIVSLYLFSYKIFNSHALVWLFTGSDG